MKKATTKTPVKDLTTEETLDHRKIILLEDIQAKMEQVIEGMESTKSELKRDINEFRAEANEHFEMLDTVVREHSKQLAEHGKQLQSIERTVNKHSEQLQSIETKIDKIGEHSDDHETRITSLETAHP